MKCLCACPALLGYYTARKRRYSMLHYFWSVHDRTIWRVNSFISVTVSFRVRVSVRVRVNDIVSFVVNVRNSRP